MHIKDVSRLLLQRRKILTVSKIFATTAIICRNQKQNPANFFSTVCGKNMRQFTNIIIQTPSLLKVFMQHLFIVPLDTPLMETHWLIQVH